MEEWQRKLEQYKTDKNAAAKEVLRAKEVYEGEKAGYGEGFDQSDRAKQIMTWANQVRAAAGLDDTQFGVGVALPQAQSNYNALTATANTPALLSENKPAQAVVSSTPGTDIQTQAASPANNNAALLAGATAKAPAAPAISANLSSSIAPTMPAQTQGTDIQKLINDLKQAQINASIANLGKAKTNALGAYAGAESQINQAAQSQKNVNSITSQKGALDFAKYLASRGLINSGTAAQGEISRNVALQGAQSAVDTNKLTQLADVAKSRANIESGYESDLAAAMAGADTDALRMAIQEAQRQDELNRNQAYQAAQLKLQEAGLTGTYNGQTTLQKQQLDTETAIQEAALTGMYKGNTTLAAQQQALDNEFRQGQFDWNKQQDLWSRGFQTGQLDYQKARDAVADEQWGKEYQLKLDDFAWSKNTENPYVRAQVLQNQAQDLNIQMAEINLENLPEQIRLSLEQTRKEINQIGVSPALTADEQEIQKIKIASAKEELTQAKIKNYSDYINTSFARETFDNDAGATIVSYDLEGIANYLTILMENGIDKDTIKALTSMYGLIYEDDTGDYRADKMKNIL